MMASIKPFLDKIRTAVYGKEVRGSLADGLDAVNKETEGATELTADTKRRQDSVEQQFDDLQQNYTEDSPSDAEIVAARTNTETGDNHTTVGRRMDAEYKQVTAQLAETDQYRFFESMINRKGKSRGMISIVDDDGDKGFYTKLRPLALEYGIVFTSALVTGVARGFPGDERTQSGKYMDYDNIMTMHEEGTAEFIGHSHTHPNLRELSLSELREEFTNSQEFLRRYGLNHRGMVFPYNRVNQQVMDEVRTFFDYSLGNAPHGVADPPFDNYYMPRNVIRFGENISDLKLLIDEAAAEDKWIILYTHVDQDGYVESDMRELIEHAISKNLEFVSTEKGVRHNGNIAQLQTPKYTDFAPDNISDIDIITSDGELLGNKLGRVTISRRNNITNDTPLSFFRERTVNYSQIRSETRLGFPENLPGVLITYNIRNGIEETYWAWQEYKPHKSNAKYIRRWDSDNAEWMDWKNQNNYVIDTSFTVTNITPITDFPFGSVTESLVKKNVASGFPEDAAGVLITHRPLEIDLNWCYQEYKAIYTDNKYVRHWTANDAFGNWSSWKKYVMEDV